LDAENEDFEDLQVQIKTWAGYSALTGQHGTTIPHRH